MLLFFRRIGNTVENTAGIAFERSERRGKVVRNACYQFFSIGLIFFPFRLGMLQFLPHEFEIAASLAEFIFRFNSYRRIQVTLPDIGGCLTQFRQRFEDLPGHEVR